MIIRENYLKKIRGFYESDLVKIIVGIRRSGKSFILKSIMDEIKGKTDNVIYLNFERTSDLLKASNAQELVHYINANKKESKCYIFLDEIQEVQDWHIAIKDLRLDNNSIFVTGSNSKLLSSEIMAHLSGRFVSFRIRPFVYKEIVELGNELGFKSDINDYLVWGGMPGRFYLSDKEEQIRYLQEVQDTIVFNDLIKRHRITKTPVFKKIVQFLLINNSRILSARNIQRYLSNECAPVSINTVLKYIGFLKEAYIIDSIPQFSKKAKKQLSFYEKAYDGDVCFNSLHVIDGRYDLDHNIENVVFNELLFMGYDVNTFINNDKEIDFIAIKDGKSFYVQVAYSVVNEKAYQREFSAFIGVDQLSKKIIISNDENDYSTSLIRHLKLKDFLLMDSLD